MFAESLLFVNRLYNKAFGVSQRKVLAHMPHFINKDIMVEVQKTYVIYENILSNIFSVCRRKNLNYQRMAYLKCSAKQPRIYLYFNYVLCKL